MSLINRMIARRAGGDPAQALAFARDALDSALEACDDAEDWVDGLEYRPLTDAQKREMHEVLVTAAAIREKLEGVAWPLPPNRVGLRRLLHLMFRHDRIECWCELDGVTPPPARRADRDEVPR